jgi:NitT/TauT family transport system substrate-binding protein
VLRHLVPILAVAASLSACGGAPATSSPTSAQAKPSAAASSAATAPGSAAAGAQRIVLKSAYTTTAATSVPFWMAKESGAFEAEGLDVTFALIAPGAPILGALESGDVPISSAGGQELVNAEVKGASMVMVAGFGERLTNSIMTIPTITKPEDLKGKALGVSGFGAISHVAGLVAVEKLGLKGQVSFVATGGLPETLAAIQSGKVQGGMLSPPQTFEATKQGLHQLYDLSKVDAKSQTSVVATTRKYTSEHPDVVERYIRAVIRGVQRAYSDKPLALAVLTKYGGISDQAIAAQTYDFFAEGGLWLKDGSPTMEGIQQNLDVAVSQNIAEAKNFKPQQLVDLTFVQKIKASGLIDELYKK